MTTVADELLNDFEDSGSEAENENGDGYRDEDTLDAPAARGFVQDADAAADRGDMELDGDEEPVEDDDDDGFAVSKSGVEVEDEEEAKAKVEKMQLGGVSDVRSVAGLMKTLEPLLEVSTILDSCLYIEIHSLEQ